MCLVRKKGERFTHHVDVANPDDHRNSVELAGNHNDGELTDPTYMRSMFDKVNPKEAGWDDTLPPTERGVDDVTEYVLPSLPHRPALTPLVRVITVGDLWLHINSVLLKSIGGGVKSLLSFQGVCDILYRITNAFIPPVKEGCRRLR